MNLKGTQHASNHTIRKSNNKEQPRPQYKYIKLLDIVQSFPFIILLYCESYECIYISPICDVGTSHYFFCGNKKIRYSLFFLSSHGIRATRENLIFG